MRLAAAFEVFDEIVAAGLEASIHARRMGNEYMDFVVALSLVDRTQEQLAMVGAIVERYELELDVGEHRARIAEVAGSVVKVSGQ